jgi:hypothetical protein
MVFTIYNSCKAQQVNKNELQPVIFQNFQDANKYLIENIKTNEINYNDVYYDLHEQFKNTGFDLMGYNEYSGAILADLDNDGTYELYLNAATGSGIIHAFIHGYNPITKKYYLLSERMETDYILFIYKNVLYLFAVNSYWNETGQENIKIYRPTIAGEELIIEDIDENIYNDIMGSIILENIYRPYSR